MNIEKLLKSLGDLENKMPSDVEEKLNESAEIKAIKEEGKLHVEVSGNAFNLLVMMARLENQLLEQIGCSKEEFEAFKLVAEMLEKD